MLLSAAYGLLADARPPRAPHGVTESLPDSTPTCVDVLNILSERLDIDRLAVRPYRESMATVPAGINQRVAISERELRELYVSQAQTIEQVAARYGLAATTISRRLREVGISARPRGPVPIQPSDRESLAWTPDLAYVVGLIAADGNLSKKPGRIAIMSNDTDLLDLVRRRLGLSADIRPHRGGYGTRCHRLVWSDRRFYDWLATTGLTPAKSLTLGPLASRTITSRISSVGASMATGRSSATSTDTTHSRARATSTRACTSRSSRRALDSSSGCVRAFSDSPTSQAMSTCGDPFAAMISGAYGMPSASRWRCCGGCTTLTTSSILSENGASLLRSSFLALRRRCGAPVGQW